MFDFLPRAAAGGLVAVPGSARGMAALSARYGKLPWAQLVAPAEAIAQTGEAASRALARDVALGEKKLRADPRWPRCSPAPTAACWARATICGRSELAGVLGQLRAKGPNELYSGVLGQQLVAERAGDRRAADHRGLRGFQVKFYEPLGDQMGRPAVFLPQPPAAGGVSVAQMLTALEAAGGEQSRRVPGRGQHAV